MKKLYYLGLAALAVFEVLNIYFIMPLPGSQRIDSLGLAYFIHEYRWLFRAVFAVAIILGARSAFSSRRIWLPVVSAIPVAALVWFVNFEMAADRIFLQPRKLSLLPRAESAVNLDAVVLGIENNGEAKAYPVRYLVYHHQVQDTIGGKSVIVTYCSVCRTGCVFEPLVRGQPEKFRLVGMDHFNAMFEDSGTRSWWRQATGEAVAGPLQGEHLPVFASRQLSLRKWLGLHPSSLVMQPDDSVKKNEYDTEGKFERGKSKGDLTRTDPGSWKDKSWVVGVQLGTATKAYDWNQLRKKQIINDVIGQEPIVLVLSSDQSGFAVFRRPDPTWTFTVKDDILTSSGQSYDFSGKNLKDTAPSLAAVESHQEFWHSWKSFHPDTQTDL